MIVLFEEDDLERMFTDSAYHSKKWHPDLVKAFRKQVNLILAVPDQRTLAAFRGLRLEKLRGGRKGQYSMRVTDQWRLIARFERVDDGQQVVIIELVDYH